MQLLITYWYLKRFYLVKNNCKYLNGYTDDYRIKPFSIIPLNTSTYVKVMMVVLNRCIFWLKMMNYWKI